MSEARSDNRDESELFEARHIGPSKASQAEMLKALGL